MTLMACASLFELATICNYRVSEYSIPGIVTVNVASCCWWVHCPCRLPTCQGEIFHA
jgi:hypothetical protein